jgi:tRNA threonylcarbamoyl adenosine modification protein YeaZ
MKKYSAPRDMGLTLAMNAAEGVLQITFADADDKLIYGQCMEASSKGAEKLTPSIRHALKLLGRGPGDIRRIAAVSGPGSFTGLRLTSATASALAHSTGAKQASFDYMSLLMRQCLTHNQGYGEKAILCCLTRARRDLVYAQCFVRDPDCRPPFRAVTELAVLSVASKEAAWHILETAMENDAAHVFLAGTGAHENRDALIPHLSVPEAPRITILNILHPMSDTLMAAALEARYSDEDISPLYVRASDAEENLPQIAVRLGLDPSEAVEKLRTLTRTKPEDTKE